MHKEIHFKVTILGCGSSGGVPRIGGIWGACDPLNPRNERTRCSIFVEGRNLEKDAEQGQAEHLSWTRFLVDTSPDLRFQLLKNKITRLDAVLFTHDHADQAHGIDDLRAFYLARYKPLPACMDKRTADIMLHRFGYCFEVPAGGIHPAILELKRLERPEDVFFIKGEGGRLPVMGLSVDHGPIRALGFRFGNIAYIPDVSDLSQDNFSCLQNLDVFIIDALRHRPHPTHAHLEKTLSWIERLKPRRAVLTNMHIDLDYDTLRKELPEHIEPAYDGMVIDTVSKIK